METVPLYRTNTIERLLKEFVPEVSIGKAGQEEIFPAKDVGLLERFQVKTSIVKKSSSILDSASKRSRDIVKFKFDSQASIVCIDICIMINLPAYCNKLLSVRVITWDANSNKSIMSSTGFQNKLWFKTKSA